MTQTFHARDIMLLLLALFGLALFMEARTATAASPQAGLVRIVRSVGHAAEWHMMQMARNEQGDAFGPWSN